MGYLWVQRGETWKAVLLGLGMAAAMTVAGLGLVAHREGPRRKPPPGPPADQGQALPPGLPGPTGNSSPILPEHGSEKQSQGPAAPRRPVLPGLRQHGRGQVQGGQGPARDSRRRALGPGARHVPGSQRPGGAGTGRPVASPWALATLWPRCTAPDPGCSSPPPAATAQGRPRGQHRGRQAPPGALQRPGHGTPPSSTWPAPAWVSPP